MGVTTVDKKLEIDAPIERVYNQWTQFEDFPRFMEGVKEVHQQGDERLYWHAEVNGKDKEWYARITRQVPDEVLAWESEGGANNAGTIVFKPLAPAAPSSRCTCSTRPRTSWSRSVARWASFRAGSTAT